jgi:hypothetical protein
MCNISGRYLIHNKYGRATNKTQYIFLYDCGCSRISKRIKYGNEDEKEKIIFGHTKNITCPFIIYRVLGKM